jgi:hypothetical protein
MLGETGFARKKNSEYRTSHKNSDEPGVPKAKCDIRCTMCGFCNHEEHKEHEGESREEKGARHEREVNSI